MTMMTRGPIGGDLTQSARGPCKIGERTHPISEGGTDVCADNSFKCACEGHCTFR